MSDDCDDAESDLMTFGSGVSLELHHAVIGTASQQCWSALGTWRAGQSVRSESLVALREELLAVAGLFDAVDPGDLALRLAAAYGVTAAVSCRSSDDDGDDTEDRAVVGGFLADLELLIGCADPGCPQIERVSDEVWSGLPDRIRSIALCLGDGTGDAESDLAACVAVALDFAAG